ncbi:Pyruvate/Phosphoenolpyruvate kinase-like domain-containing protein [Aspergillus similis]
MRDRIKVYHRFECYNIYTHVVEAGYHTGTHWIRDLRTALAIKLCQGFPQRFPSQKTANKSLNWVDQSYKFNDWASQFGNEATALGYLIALALDVPHSTTIQRKPEMLNTKNYNALSLAQPTNFKAMLNSGDLLWGTGCRIPHPEAARVVAATPYHFCFLDAEHAPLNATLLVSLIRTIQYHSNGSMVPFVRIPKCSPELFNYALGAGAGGVVMPHVQNAKQAEELVRLCRFPLLGDRSFPPAALIGERQNRTPEGKTTYDVWDGHAAVICQIEDLEGLENIEEICGVPGVQSTDCSSAPGDLRMCLDLAHGSLDGDEPVFLSALRKIRDAAKANSLPIMGFGISPAGVQLRRE